MGKIKAIIITVLILSAFLAGVYFKDNVIKFYSDFINGVKNFKTIDIGNILQEAERQVNLPPPLKISGLVKPVTLLQSKIILETNLQRKENGDLPALTENEKLDEAAAAKAADMFSKQYFEHVSPSGIGPGDLAKTYGYDYIVEGENLILGNFSSEKELVQYWMDSPGHRANILNNRYSEIGVAVVKGTYKGETVWIGVQEFGLPMSSCEKPSDSFKNQIDYSQNQLNDIALQINERKQELENTNPKSPAYRQMVADYNQMIQSYNALVDTIKTLVAQYNQQVNSFNNCVQGQ